MSLKQVFTQTLSNLKTYIGNIYNFRPRFKILLCNFCSPHMNLYAQNWEKNKNFNTFDMFKIKKKLERNSGLYHSFPRTIFVTCPHTSTLCDFFFTYSHRYTHNELTFANSVFSFNFGIHMQTLLNAWFL
jgi:hypothetical protein